MDWFEGKQKQAPNIVRPHSGIYESLEKARRSGANPRSLGLRRAYREQTPLKLSHLGVRAWVAPASLWFAAAVPKLLLHTPSRRMRGQARVPQEKLRYAIRGNRNMP